MKQHYQGLGHIAVYTADMDASIAFYEKIGGSLHLRAPACPPEQQRELALVEFGGFLVELIAAPVPEGAGCIPHFAVYVDDVDQAAADLRALGQFARGDGTQICFPDARIHSGACLFDSIGHNQLPSIL